MDGGNISIIIFTQDSPVGIKILSSLRVGNHVATITMTINSNSISSLLRVIDGTRTQNTLCTGWIES